MTALPQSFATSPTPMRSAPADREDGRVSRDTDRNITAQSFEDAVREQSGSDEASTIATDEVTQDPDVRLVADTTQADIKADIIPIADPNGSEMVRPEAPTPGAEIALTTTIRGAGSSSPDAETSRSGESARDINTRGSVPIAGADTWREADLRVTPNSSAQPSADTAVPAGPAAGHSLTATTDADVALPTAGRTQTGAVQTQTQSPSQPPLQPQSEDGASPQSRTGETPAPQGQNSVLSPVTIGTAPADGRQTDQPDLIVAKADVTPIAEVDGDADLRPTTKTTPTLTEPTKPSVELLRASDLPSIQTLPTATTDTLTAPKTLPLTPQVPTLTPIGGLGERIVANYIHSMPNTGPVTLDKLPQTVVALAMNSQSATLQIDPPELGRIQLEYQFDTQGKTVITLVPESDAARTALAERMASISAALSQNAPGEVDVRLGDANDFNSEQQADANEHHGEGGMSSSHHDSDALGHSGALKEASSLSFSRSPSGQTERLHILV